MIYGFLRFRLVAAVYPERARSRGCFGAGTRYCRGPAEAQRLRFAERRFPRQLPARGRALTGPSEIRVPGRSCLQKVESRLTPLVAMSAHRSVFPALLRR